MSHKSTPGSEPIYDARTLGLPKMLVLGLQPLFAMFGATVLVPILVQDPLCGRALPGLDIRRRASGVSASRATGRKNAPQGASEQKNSTQAKGRKAERQNTLTPFLKPLLPFTVKNNCTFSRRAGQ